MKIAQDPYLIRIPHGASPGVQAGLRTPHLTGLEAFPCGASLVLLGGEGEIHLADGESSRIIVKKYGV